MAYINRVGRSGQRATYPISFVEGLGHNVRIVCDEAIETKQTKGFLEKNRTFVPKDSDNTTYALCPRVNIDD